MCFSTPGVPNRLDTISVLCYRMFMSASSGSLIPEIASSPELAAYNAELPVLPLTPGLLDFVFTSLQDQLKVLGPREKEKLKSLGGAATSLEIAFTLVNAATDIPPDDSKKLTTSLFEQGNGLIYALEETTVIEDAKTNRGLQEARLLYDSIILDPVIAAPGSELINRATDQFKEP